VNECNFILMAALGFPIATLLHAIAVVSHVPATYIVAPAVHRNYHYAYPFSLPSFKSLLCHQRDINLICCSLYWLIDEFIYYLCNCMHFCKIKYVKSQIMKYRHTRNYTYWSSYWRSNALSLVIIMWPALRVGHIIIPLPSYRNELLTLPWFFSNISGTNNTIP